MFTALFQIFVELYSYLITKRDIINILLLHLVTCQYQVIMFYNFYSIINVSRYINTGQWPPVLSQLTITEGSPDN